MTKVRWFDRVFDDHPDVSLLPMFVERLRGTPARLEERLRGLSAESLTRRVEDTWSIQENAAHLMVIEPLWMQRVDDLQQSADTLTAADLENTATHDGNFNSKGLGDILSQFRSRRTALVERLDGFTPEQAAWSARHPRLDHTLRTIDHVHFVAEHDDHHLARITELLRAST